MKNIWLIFLVITCIMILVWGLVKKERILQYPFFMASIFFAFLVPQALALSLSPGSVPSHAVNRILLYSTLCLLMCWVGYKFPPKLKRISAIAFPMRLCRVMKLAWLFVVFGNACSLALNRITIQVTDTGTWTGPATILYFFSKASLVGGTILLLLALSYHYKARINLAGCAFALYPTIVAIIYAGRRQPTATVCIILVLGVFFSRHISPPRWLVASIVISTAFLIPLLGALRGDFWQLLLSGNLAISDIRVPFHTLLQGEILELRNAALIAEASNSTGQYGYGTGFWNSIVFQFVPGQWLGYGFKESLYIKVTNYSLLELFNYKPHTGTTITGVGDSFREFGYFGCFSFLLIAFLFKNLWIAAVHFRSLYSQILYIGLVSPALVGLTHGIGRFLQEALFQLTLVSLVAIFSRSKRI